jgi:nitrous oxidase accessory protein
METSLRVLPTRVREQNHNVCQVTPDSDTPDRLTDADSDLCETAHKNADSHTTENLSGALVMYSKRVFLRGNQFSKNHGGTGFGLLLKNVDDLWAEDNRITANGTGVSLDEAPASPTATVTFHRNLIALNQTGLALLTTTAVTFYENSMVDNLRQVSGRGSNLTIAGHGSQPAPAGGVDHPAHGDAPAAYPAAPSAAAAGAAAGNRWSADGRGNYWSDYTGYDGDGDGLGDRPYRSVSAFAALRGRNAALDLFSYTPAQQAIDAAARLFPLVRPEVLIEDPAPLITPPTPLPRAGDGRGLLVSAAALLLAGALPTAIGGGRGRPVRRPALERIPS